MKQYREEILSMVMAGGRGERLFPLTMERTKPSVPFGGKYRIIDFALSNFINSGVYSIYVLVQYKSQSLIEHIRTTWTKGSTLPNHFVTVVPPQMRKEKEWYRGTADSIHQNINLVYDFKPRLVAIFGGDHIYRMNIKEMIDYHLKKKAQATVAVIPIDSKDAGQFGVADTASDGRISRFIEKPKMPKGKTVLASMGNYIFNAEFLIDVLAEDARKNTDHDFGKNILPFLIEGKKAKIYAYDFSSNRIPSLKKYEADYYWRDVGTIKSYWEANMDLLGKNPKLDLDNQDWPIYASNLDCPPAHISDSQVENSLICEGARVDGAIVNNSIVGRSVKIEPGCVVQDSIILDFSRVGAGSQVKKAIVDRFNIIDKNSKVYRDKNLDSSKYFLDSSGIVVVKRGARKVFYF
jgi:glucose-1-phosphate adenylyltransferase